MELVLRGSRITFLGVFALLLMGGQAHAVTYNFTVNPNPPNEDEAATFRLTPTNASVRNVFWDLDGDGSFDDGSSRQVTRTYANAGPVTVRMAAREDSDEPWQTVTKTITVNGAPTADFTFSPAQPLEGQAVAFSGTGTDAQGDSLSYSWSFDDDDADATGADVSHTFERPGTYDVALTVTDEHGASSRKTLPVTVVSDPGPAASFSFSPDAPLTGDEVTFSSSSAPSQGTITSQRWDLDGDGAFNDATGPTATWSYSTPGSRTVGLRVEQSNGEVGITFASVEVAERPPPDPPDPADPPDPPDSTDSPEPSSTAPAPGPDTQDGGGNVTLPVPTPRPLARMRPFPVVRIAGTVLSNGARVTILSVRAPRGARIAVRCSGPGCPVRSLARTSATRLVRLRRFERRLRAGTRLIITVQRSGRIGKYTRFVIRAGKPPARVDRCLIPGRTRPVACG